jgi:hypothetical protein
MCLIHPLVIGGLKIALLIAASVAFWPLLRGPKDKS